MFTIRKLKLRLAVTYTGSTDGAEVSVPGVVPVGRCVGSALGSTLGDAETLCAVGARAKRAVGRRVRVGATDGCWVGGPVFGAPLGADLGS